MNPGQRGAQQNLALADHQPDMGAVSALTTTTMPSPRGPARFVRSNVIFCYNRCTFSSPTNCYWPRTRRVTVQSSSALTVFATCLQ